MRRLAVALAPLALLMGASQAAAQLTITPITWNVIGLDSNNVNVGPNRFPVGARVCNVGASTATNVRAELFFDGGMTNPYISLFGQKVLSVDSLPAGPPPPAPSSILQKPANCADFYFLVDIMRSSAAYSSRISDTATPAQRNTQLFHIEATATGLGTVSTPLDRELYVEKLISQGRNAIQQFSGPTNVVVGGTYTYTLNAVTAPGGYEQLEVFTNFPNNIFQITDVSTTYSSPAGAVNSTVYADACGWENRRTSPAYHNNLTCIGPENYPGAKAGNLIRTTITVKILSAGTATVQSAINDFSGSSYHYNADFGDPINSVTITASNPVSGADLTVFKTHTPMSVGATGTYTVSVSNAGGAATSGQVTVTDTLPTGLTPTGASGTGWTCTVSGQTVTCRRSDALAPGSTYPDITINTSVTATKAGLLTNTVSVAGGGDTNASNNAASDPTSVSAAIDLSITKTQTTPTAGASVANGGPVVYRVAVTNLGPAAADGAVVADPVVSGFRATSVTCVSSNSNQAPCPSGLTVASFQDGIVIPVFPKGNTLTFTITGTAEANSAYRIDNSAYVVPPSGSSDSNNADNSATASTTIQNPPPVANNDAATTTVGQPVTFSVTANDTDTSPGSVNVASVDLDPAAAGIQTTRTVAGQGTFTVNSLGEVTFTPVAGFTGTSSITYTVQDNVGAASAAATITVTVVRSADLVVTKTDTRSSVPTGSTTTYVVRVTNAGPDASGAGTTLRDPAVAGLTVTAVACSTASGNTCVSPAPTVAQLQGGVALPSLNSGAFYELLVTGTVTSAPGSTVTNTATVTSPAGTTDPTGNNTASDTNPVTASADLATDKTGPAAVGSGQGLTYIIRVWNNGPSPTTGATLTDTLPAGLTGAAVTCAATGTAACGTWSVTNGVLNVTTGNLPLDTTPANATPDGNFLTYTVTATAPASGLLSNTVSVSAPAGTTDGPQGNNTSVAVTTRIIDAVGDSNVTVPAGTARAVAVLGNDTIGGSAATAAAGKVTVTNSGGLSGLTVNGNGEIVVPANAAPGSYTVTYSLCDVTVTGACDTATVAITVSPAATPDLTLTKSGPAYARPSTLANSDPAAGPVVAAQDSFISYTLTVNTARANATGTTTVTDTLPTGLSWAGGAANFTAGPGTWTCAVSGQVVTCTTTSTIALGIPQTITLRDVRVAPGTAAGATFTNTATVSNPNEAAADAGAGNTGTATTQLVLTQVSKQVRTLPGGTFGTAASIRPGDVLEYCIDTRNLGGADLANYVLTDNLNSNGRSLTAVTTDAAYGGKAIKWTRTPASGAPTSGNSTAASGDDAGTLNDTTLTMNLGTLLAGESVRTCFQVQVR